jgi:SAM-dependent methyltransferase
MYNFLKKLILRILPKGILFRAEPFLRRIYYPFYRGRAFHCNICNSGLRRFIPMPDGDLLCPNCGSISRDRRLWELINAEFIRENTRILDFSPSRSLYRKFTSLHTVSYNATDISGDFISDAGYDITGIDAETGSYDLLICYHILEHVEDDRKAMEELYRVLSGEGACIVQTPFREGDINEDPSIVSAEDRLEHFGQEDHVRIYSVSGLEKRLSEAGFSVEVRDYAVEPGNAGGFQERETILICRKQAV